MAAFASEVIELAERENEVTLITRGRKTGKAVRVVIWFCTDGKGIFVRAGGGLSQHWPRNLLAAPEATLRLGRKSFEVRARHLADPDEARAISRCLNAKYGPYYDASKRGEAPTPGEQATFELIPTG